MHACNLIFFRIQLLLNILHSMSSTGGYRSIDVIIKPVKTNLRHFKNKTRIYRVEIYDKMMFFYIWSCVTTFFLLTHDMYTLIYVCMYMYVYMFYFIYLFILFHFYFFICIYIHLVSFISFYYFYLFYLFIYLWYFSVD